MLDQVVPERHALDDAPRRRTVLIARRELDRESRLIGNPAILEDVAFDDHVLRVLQFKDVLDRPLRRAAGCAARAGRAAIGERRGRRLPVNVFRALIATINEVFGGAGHRRPRDLDAA